MTTPRAAYGRSAILVWAVLALVFVLTTVPQVYHAVVVGSFDSPSAFHSTDKYLRACADMANGSARLITLFQSIPKDRPLVIYYRERDDESSFLSMLLAYLSWPHPVHRVAIDTAAPKQPVDPHHTAALVFCKVVPPEWLQGRINLSPSLVVIPSSAR